MIDAHAFLQQPSTGGSAPIMGGAFNPGCLTSLLIPEVDIIVGVREWRSAGRIFCFNAFENINALAVHV